MDNPVIIFGANELGRAAVEMRERFEAKGLFISENIHEPPDHIAIELEYLYFLLDKGWGEQDHALVAEAVEFCSQTMLPWISKMEERVAAEKKCEFYQLSATILLEILQKINSLTGK